MQKVILSDQKRIWYERTCEIYNVIKFAYIKQSVYLTKYTSINQWALKKNGENSDIIYTFILYWNWLNVLIPTA